ncbi:MAG: EAL domain-containing protein [Ruminococcaceae bacterium]|nr:EAL domain-containing protein [Oscillospiraceae bacterium]
MNYGLLLSMILYICGCFYMIFGAGIVTYNAKSKVNKLFLILTISLSVWSFSYSISASAPTSEVSAFWRSFSVLGWGVFNSILLHFLLVLTKSENRLNKRIMLIALYLPAFINIILFGPFGYFVEKQYEMVQTDFGWMNMAPMYSAGIWIVFYYIIFSIISLILLFSWWKKVKSNTLLKAYAKYFIISIILLFLILGVIDIIPDLLNEKFFPKIPVLLLLIPTIMLYVVLKKFGLITERRRKTHSFPELKKNLAQDRYRLFRMATTVLLLATALSFLVGYFAMGGSLEDELLIASVLLLIALSVRLIPYITKNHIIQNTIFLLVSTTGTLYFMLVNAYKGALTIWSVYILFLLFTVLLDNKIYAVVFTIFSIASQIVFWFVYPEISVTIDGNEYLLRIIIIMISYFAVQYLTNEYTLKVSDYKKFAREQEILERVSNSFISISSENVNERIGEMLEAIIEILEFNHAYFLEFSEDYESATVLNSYARDIENEFSLFQPGMKVHTASLPMFKSLIDQSMPMIYEDIEDISVEEEEEKNFFISRGIKSYFALPIETDGKIDGILVVEYNERIDISVAESRLYFLKIIAITLGEAKKKTLYEKRLFNFAYFDEATKLANRNMLVKSLNQSILESSESEKIAVLDIKILNLRMIKDTFGYAVGEQIIIKSAAILIDLFKECCEIARTGDGDFVVVMPNIKSDDQIQESANRILDSFSEPVSIETGIDELFVVVGVGVAVYPEDGLDADTLLKNADLAGYEARIADKKIIFYNTQLENDIAENTLLTNKLFRSLQNNEFSLEFQPQISCKTGKTAGVEALLRWTTDDRRRIPPNRFVPMLEQTGLIYDVGLWVLEQALEEHKKFVEKGFPPLRISVNLSIVQFKEEAFIPDFTKIIKESSVDPKYIELEITESLFSENPKAVIIKLNKLKELGLKVAIDDFGRGYSSLNRLNFVPFDRIKIDKDIVDYIDLQKKSAPLMKVIILLARAYNASVTAEGVETKNQAEFLKSISCDEIQGFYFSKPLTAEALEEFLKKERNNGAITC